MNVSPIALAWMAVFAAVVLSTSVDALSTLAWKKQTWQFFALTIVMAPLTFLSFGYVGHKFGLSIASCLINSLMVLGPIIVGLIFFDEWKKMSLPMYFGMALVLLGITIIVLCKKDE